MTLRRKIRLLTLLAVIGCLVAAAPALYLLRQGLIDERQHATQALVHSAEALMQAIRHRADSGQITDDDARTQARDALLALGQPPFKVLVSGDDQGPAAGQDGQVGPEPGKEPVKLTAGTTLEFPDWGWQVQIASSTTDLDYRFVLEAAAFGLFLLLLLLLGLPVSSFLSAQVVGPIEFLSARMRDLTTGDTRTAIPGHDRRDEFGDMARSIDYFRQAVSNLIERDQRLLGIMSSVSEAIVLVNEQGRIEEHNPAAVTLFGVSAKNLPGRDFAGLFAPSERSRIITLMSGHDELAKGAVRVPSVLLARSDDRIEASLTVALLELPDHRSFVCSLADITRRMQQERELLRLATRDRLTGLPNRAMIESVVQEWITLPRSDTQFIAVLCLDLSRFKLITDTLGHAAGDELLVEVARRITGSVRMGDTVGRIGSDDFAIILDQLSGEEEVTEIATRILATFDAPIPLFGTEHYVRPSIGMALYPQHADSPQELLRAADTALYAAKRVGGRRLSLFRPEMAAQARMHLALDRDLRAALAHNQFCLHYQPKVSLLDHSLEGFEALLRWEKPDGSMIPPGDFIPVAEDTGFIVQLGDWVLEEACRQLREWLDAGLDPVPVAVNISPRQLRQRSAEDFRQIIDRYGLSPDLVEMEITEGAVMQDMAHALNVLQSLKDMGIRVAVDDFGTGHSSLSYLKRLPVTTLKIDRSFVNGVPLERHDNGIVSTIIAMADMLGLSVVAEGVEKQEQANFLRRHNCTIVQGWLTGRPVPAEKARMLLTERLRTRDEQAAADRVESDQI